MSSSAEANTVRIVLATRNPGKIREIRSLVSSPRFELLGLDDFPGAPEVDETGSTLRENALLKARVIHDFTAMPSVADDSGHEVDALDGAPGDHSARFAGPGADDAANRCKLLSVMSGVADRSARFRTVIAFVDGGLERFFEGVCEGRIIDRERGSGGFGYDALFVADGHDRTFAELQPEEKNAVSHRGRAVRTLAAYLNHRYPERIPQS